MQAAAAQARRHISAEEKQAKRGSLLQRHVHSPKRRRVPQNVARWRRCAASGDGLFWAPASRVPAAVPVVRALGGPLRTRFCTSTEALPLRSSLTEFKCPPAAARWRHVFPACSTCGVTHERRRLGCLPVQRWRRQQRPDVTPARALSVAFTGTGGTSDRSVLTTV